MTTALTPAPQEERIEAFLRRPDTVEKFTPILGRGANSFISSALILINSDPKLQECTTISLYKSILRAATLELSLDPAARQGYIIPRRKKVKSYRAADGTVIPEHYVMEANFQPHYNGTRNLAERTGRYLIINVSPVYEGQRILLNQMTGLHYFDLGGGLLGMPEQTSRMVAGTIDVTDGKPEKRVIGYLGYYKTTRGIERTVYMTIREIHEHAQMWAKDNYESQYGSWKDPKKLPYMEMKTVFIQLTKTMDLSGRENEKLRKAIEIEEGDDFTDLGETTEAGREVIDAETDEQTETPKIEPIAAGFSKPEATDGNPDPVTDVTWKMYTETAQKAEKAGVKFTTVKRGDTTDGDLIAYIKELEVKIKRSK